MTRRLDELKIAIVADWLTDRGGAERVILSLAEIFPRADIFTSVFKSANFPEFANRRVFTTYLQSWPLHFKHQLYSWARPKAFESLNLDAYDLVVSSSHAESKGVLTQPHTTHICYCHTPTRYYWSHYHEYMKARQFGALDPIAKLFIPSMIHNLREWDRVAADRVDFFIANSQHTQNRIRKFYNLDATIINPPVNFERFSGPAEAGDYYLVLGRQIPYKRTDLVIEAFKTLSSKLKVVGDGPELEKLKKLATGAENIEILGRIPDSEVTKLVLGCKAVIFPQEEDFGIVPLEAMSAGKPVIAYACGGALETVVDGQTGILFPEQTAASLVSAIHKFEQTSFSSDICRERARQFDETVFRQKITDFIQSHLDIKPTAREL
jgi:glycosyltransferase involved in cell wall biosynthesis